MLDNKTIEIIKSTVPVLQRHGESITGRFYDLMFQNHPELLNIFNQTNQKKKTQRTALANAVIAVPPILTGLAISFRSPNKSAINTAVSALSLNIIRLSANIC